LKGLPFPVARVLVVCVEGVNGEKVNRDRKG